MTNLDDDKPMLDRTRQASFDANIEALEVDVNDNNNDDDFGSYGKDNKDTLDRFENGVCDFLSLCLPDDNYVCHLVDRLRKVNHASIASGVARLPHAPYTRLQSRLFDAGSISNRSDGGNYIDPERVDDNIDSYRKHIELVDETITLGDGKTRRGIKRKNRFAYLFSR